MIATVIISSISVKPVVRFESTDVECRFMISAA